jgi:hypothetical protein
MIRASIFLGVLVACLGACLEDEVPVSVDGGGASSGSPASSSSSSSGNSSSGQSMSSSSSSSSSSGGSPPPPPPPTPIPGGCYVDGKVLPAGPAPSEIAGDCYHDSCDGTSKDGLRTFDANDTKKDDNPCAVHTCTPQGPTDGFAENGKSCGTDGGVCFQGKCTVCKPQNTTTCSAEGGNEPANDSATTATAYSEYSTVCAFSGGSDVDWYTFYADDGAFTNDVFDFEVWSTAPSVEVCIYVACGGGSSPTGCSGGKSGPNGSYGCCWSGTPNTLKPHWDLDCAGTTEDSGTTYVSVRAVGGDSCEPYLISGHY